MLSLSYFPIFCVGYLKDWTSVVVKRFLIEGISVHNLKNRDKKLALTEGGNW